ncbi:MAG: VOC family protein [Acidimicrobiales bacterium]
MAISRLNHAVLYVRDAAASAKFYVDILGFKIAVEFPGAAFLRTSDTTPNDHDLGLFSVGAGAAPSAAGRQSVGLYHLAWEVPTLAEMLVLREKLQSVGALVGESDHGESKSLYGQDPDGIEFELVWAVPADRIDPSLDEFGTKPIDWTTTVARFGADTPGRNTYVH